MRFIAVFLVVLGLSIPCKATGLNCGSLLLPGQADPSTQSRLAKIFKQTEFSKGLSRLQIEKLVEKIYDTAEGSPYSFFSGNPNLKAILYRVFQERLSSDGLEAALKDVGLYRDPSLRERLQILLRQKKVKLALTGVLNLPILMTGLPYLPHQKWARWINVDEWLERVVVEGFDAVWPELNERYKTLLKVDLVYQQVQPVVMTGVVVLVLYLLYDKVHQFKIKSDTQIDGVIRSVRNNLKNLQDRNNDALRSGGVGQSIFSEWVENYHKKYGRNPDPNSEEYRRTRKFLLNE